MNQNVNEQNQPYLKRLYNSLGTWIFIYVMLIASGIYIIETDFSFAPHKQIKTGSENHGKSLTNPGNESLKVNNPNSMDKSKTIIADDKAMTVIVEK